jgi:hypothetical protein
MPIDAETRLTSRLKADGDCPVWTGCRNWAGYGKMSVNGKLWATHRFAYQLANGPIPEGVHICHHCDNPPCCNPRHLYAGSDQTNADDRKTRGRQRNGMLIVRGEGHGMSKITDEDVREIRRLRRSGLTHAAISSRFNIGKAMVSHITNWRCWRHVRDDAHTFGAPQP